MIKDLDELDKLLKLCRKRGVDEISIDGTTVKFGELPAKNTSKTAVEEPDDDSQIDGIPDDEMIFYAVENAGIQ